MPGPETVLPLAQQRRPVRVATVQWALGQSSELPALLEALEHTVATLAGYGVELAVFPEFFHVNLLKGARFAQGPAQMRKLAEYTEPLLAAFRAWPSATGSTSARAACRWRRAGACST